MSFLEPLLLAALPLAGLPILIHLINQRRFQTIDWGAMRFLLEANRMSRGFARIRRWLILLFRALAVAAIVFVISRPLASGWLGLASGGRADTTLILVDRSPSMQQTTAGAAASKLQTGVAQLARTLGLVGSQRWVLIDSATLAPQELSSADALLESSAVEATSASAELPELLQVAHDYIQDNRIGQTEVWILSDLRENDWNARDGKWRSLRDSFLEFKQGVRFHLLAYPEPAAENVGIRVTAARRVATSDGAALLLSLRLTARGGPETKSVPVRFELEGGSSEEQFEWDGNELEVKDHLIPIDAGVTRGCGRVSIPADTYPADDRFYFVFAESSTHKTVIVADEGEAPRPLQLAASISPHDAAANSIEVVAPDQTASVVWDEVSLLLWQAALPRGGHREVVESFVDGGGQVIFLPPQNPDTAEFHGVRWQSWQKLENPVAVETWRSDHDLLARSQSGAALPVGELRVFRYCQLDGETTPLAALREGAPLLARATSPRGGIYFLATTVAARDSSLARDGLVLYALVQRALASGAESRGNTRSLVAGSTQARAAAQWQRLAGPKDALSSEYAYIEGVYASGERMIAINRSEPEDTAEVLEARRVDDLFAGLDFDRVSDQAGSFAALAREIWRLFLVAMLVALFIEALLCIPKAAAHKRAFA